VSEHLKVGAIFPPNKQPEKQHGQQSILRWLIFHGKRFSIIWHNALIIKLFLQQDTLSTWPIVSCNNQLAWIQAIDVYPMNALVISQDEERNGTYVLFPMTPGGAT
jgi:hypothetical protein